MHVTNECLDLFEVMNYIQRDEVYSKRTIKHYYLTKQLNNHYLNRCKSALKANPSLQPVVKFVISTPAYLKKVIKMSVKNLERKINKQTHHQLLNFANSVHFNSAINSPARCIPAP